jgi:LPXTG-motif cell wall-anchored protein
MTLTGTPKLGEYMTVVTVERLDGNFFDIWMCPNKDILPRDGVDTGSACVAVTFWERFLVNGWSRPTGAEPQTVATSLKWQLSDEFVPGLDPSNDQPYLTSDNEEIAVEPPESGSWCDYAGWYIIVNDYDGDQDRGYNQHSNWSEAFSSEGCPEGSGGSGSSGAGSLPDTGASSTAGIVAGSLGLAAIAGGLLLVRARRLRANGN